MAKDRFAFNGYDLTSWLTVSQVSRQVLPSRRLNRQELPGGDGDLVAANGLEALEIEVTCNLRADSVAGVTTQRRLLAAALMTGSAAQLILPDEPHLWLMALYEGGAEVERNAHKPEVKLTFLVPDPVAYGEARETTVSGSAVLNVGGTRATPPVVRALPPRGSSWRVSNDETGEYVEVQRSFTGVETVVVDMGAHRCIVDGVDVPVTLASDYFRIAGDAQHVTLSGGTATVSWVERWA